MNLFAFSGLSAGTLSLFLAVLALYFGRTRLHRILLLFNIVVAIWSFGLFLASITENDVVAISAWEWGSAGGIFVGPLFLHLVAEHCGYDRRLLLRIGYGIAALFGVLLVSTDYIISDLHPVHGIHFIKATPLYLVGLLHYFIYTLVANWDLARYATIVKGSRRNQTLIILCSFGIGFLGSSGAILPMLDASLYFPWLNFGLSFYVCSLSYAILQHRVLDFQLIFKKTLIFSLSAGLITGFFVIIVLGITKLFTVYVKEESFAVTLGAALLIAVIFDPLKRKTETIIDHLFYGGRPDYPNVAKEASGKLAGQLDRDAIRTFVTDTIFEVIEPGAAHFFTEENNSFVPAYSRSNHHQGITAAFPEIPNNSPIILHLQRTPHILLQPIQEINSRFSSPTKADNNTSANLVLIVPIQMLGELTDMLILEEKPSGESFSSEEITLLATLANQTSISLNNALLYEQIEENYAELEEAYTYTRTINESLRLEIATRKGTEQELKEALKKLELEIQEKTREVAERIKTEKEKVALQEQLYQSQKIEAIGRLAGGVAHDFNNILSIIIGYAEIVIGQLPMGSQAAQDLCIIKDAGHKAAALTHQLLAFSRKQVLQMQTVDLNELVNNLIKMLRRTIGENIVLDVLTGNNPLLAHVDPGQIEQVLLNLTINARDAMPKGGQLSIAAKEITVVTGEEGHPEGVAPGTYSVLTITDTGCGMSPEIQEKIFEPFYTTKELGKGTGLGLATVYGIVNQHGGVISVNSHQELGTTFNVYLPTTPLDSIQQEEQYPPLKRIGSETILVAEDEPAIRKYLTTVLVPLGYRVLTAANGEDALQVSADYKEEIQLLLTDVIMSGMNGRELANLLLLERPSLKVLFMSGYTDDIIGQHGVLDSGEHLLQKPLTMEKLTAILRQILDEGRGNSSPETTMDL